MKRYHISWQEKDVVRAKEFADTTMLFLNIQKLLAKGVSNISIKVFDAKPKKSE